MFISLVIIDLLSIMQGAFYYLGLPRGIGFDFLWIYEVLKTLTHKLSGKKTENVNELSRKYLMKVYTGSIE